LSANAIRYQQVVGSNPTGGSRKFSKYKTFTIHLGGHSVDQPPIVRDLSEFVKEDDTVASTSGQARRFISALQSSKERGQKD
jgi:hypothetical protein